VREIVLDTETTGLSPEDGHRLIEIGCLELINRVPTGRTYQQYIHPEREIGEDATRIHGLTSAFLETFPTFKEVAPAFLEFIGESPLVIHNAAFDCKFLNAELATLGHPELSNPITCTLIMARKKFPGSPANLDALCRRFQIDNSNRVKHGALVDSEILAQVYFRLLGGSQAKTLFSLGEIAPTAAEEAVATIHFESVSIPRRTFPLSEEEALAHETFVREHIASALWLKQK